MQTANHRVGDKLRGILALFYALWVVIHLSWAITIAGQIDEARFVKNDGADIGSFEIAPHPLVERTDIEIQLFDAIVDIKVSAQMVGDDRIFVKCAHYVVSLL